MHQACLPELPFAQQRTGISFGHMIYWTPHGNRIKVVAIEQKLHADWQIKDTDSDAEEPYR